MLPAHDLPESAANTCRRRVSLACPSIFSEAVFFLLMFFTKTFEVKLCRFEKWEWAFLMGLQYFGGAQNETKRYLRPLLIEKINEKIQPCKAAFFVLLRRPMPYERARRVLTSRNDSLYSLKRFWDTFAFSGGGGSFVLVKFRPVKNSRVSKNLPIFSRLDRSRAKMQL